MFESRTAARIRLSGVPDIRQRRRALRRYNRVQQQARPVPQTASPPAIQRLEVSSHQDGWALMVDELETPAWVVSTKKQAERSAKQAAQHHRCTLVVRTRSGKIQKTLDFRATPGS